MNPDLTADEVLRKLMTFRRWEYVPFHYGQQWVLHDSHGRHIATHLPKQCGPKLAAAQTMWAHLTYMASKQDLTAEQYQLLARAAVRDVYSRYGKIGMPPTKPAYWIKDEL
ncbi:hypothetical protein GCM10007907_16750 [Chitinimonas prasina]|uniref:Uncharacterized protein n=1 Tax=Chitinimonas prasina TaxID=1434937 RepID=A0ABQ5YD61_9NEIS|nr:hypothetical protein [Chitinimonas prasina]GLR12885.1 hypothetical protein GCM10007907_16750 [Chitinimonas prasina]